MKRAIQLQPNFAEAYAALGAHCHRLDRPQEAVQACGEAIRLKTDYAHLCVGLVSLRTGNNSHAVEEDEILKNLDPNMAKVLTEAIVKSKILTEGRIAGGEVAWLTSQADAIHLPFTISSQMRSRI